MTPRKRALTAQIKPETRNAIMDQLALAASEIERLRDARREYGVEPWIVPAGVLVGWLLGAML